MPSQPRKICLWFLTTSYLPVRQQRRIKSLRWWQEFNTIFRRFGLNLRANGVLIWQGKTRGTDLEWTLADVSPWPKEGAVAHNGAQHRRPWRIFGSSARQSQRQCAAPSPASQKLWSKAYVWSVLLRQGCAPLVLRHKLLPSWAPLLTSDKLDPQLSTSSSSLGT